MITSCVATPGLTVIVVEIAVVRAPSVKVSVYGPTSSLIARPAKAARPVVAETVAVPLVTVPAAVVTVAVTVEELPMMALPPASATLTTGWRCV